MTQQHPQIGSDASPNTSDQATTVQRAWRHIAAGNHTAACRQLEALGTEEPVVAMPLRLARNLGCMAEHRPEAYAVLQAAGPAEVMSRYAMHRTSSGRFVPAARRDDGRFAPVSLHQDPAEDARQVSTQLVAQADQGQALAMTDLVDGYVLTDIARRPTDGPMGEKQAVYVVERDVSLALACMMLHDWSGDDGPIADERFHWFLGAGAFDGLAKMLWQDMMLLSPQLYYGRDPALKKLKQVLARCEQHRQTLEADWTRRIDEHYADFRCEALTVGVPRRPRILLITSRFTTVLKYATGDCEEALRRLGWRTRTLIEPSNVHRMTAQAIRRTLATYKPDVVFCIDSLRSHCVASFPQTLPFICWVQDQLTQFTNHKAGRSIGPHDFVLSMVGQMYTRQWSYPARQIVEMPKLTRIPPRPESWTSRGLDLTYVSNASQTIDTLMADLDTPLLEAAGRAMCDAYARGGALPTMWQVGNVLDEEAKRLSQSLTAEQRALTVNRLYHPFNNALYRQQSLRWVIEAADDMGLSLGLYGKGWDQHPDFARFAKDPVAYGPDLEELTRDSKINLQIVPSFCLHQRMLDGLVAGGFFLVRHHPSDTLMPKLLALLDPDSQTAEEALAAAGPRREQLQRLLGEARCLADLGMPIELVSHLRACRRSELMTESGEALPCYDEVSFDSAESVRARIERFVHDEPLRRAIAQQQRASVENRLSYVAGLRRTLARIGRLLAEEYARQPDAGRSRAA